jgi:hypothetical protein
MAGQRSWALSYAWLLEAKVVADIDDHPSNSSQACAASSIDAHTGK